MSAEHAEARLTRRVDPRTLVVRANGRAAAEPDAELVESVRIHGVMQPPLVYADGEDLVLIAGHRRTAAAITAGLERIEVVVGPPMDAARRIAAQVSENTNRAGLRVAEVAEAVEQMTLLGVPAGQIAKAAGLRAAQVEAARKVAEAGKTVKAAIIEAASLTLDQAAALTEWADDPAAVVDLLGAAEDGPVRFAHIQARLVQERQAQQELAAARDEWIGKGYQVLNPDGGYDQLPPGAAYVRDLADADGQRLGPKGYYGTADGHARCPDRAVTISRYSGPDRVQEVCLNPNVNGHRKAPPPYGGRSGAAKDSAERKTVIENNKLWRAATGVRHTHLKGFIVAGKFPAALVTAMHRHLLAHPEHLDRQRGAVFDAMTGFTASGVRTTETRQGLIRRTTDPAAPANRVAGQLLAAAADAAERSLATSTWRTHNPGGAGWLSLLVAHTGYQLADIEAVAMKATDPAWIPPRTAAPSTAATPATPPRGRASAAKQAARP